MTRKISTATAALALILSTAAFAQSTRWDRDIGKEAPRLIPAGWVGTPVSLEVLRKSHDELAPRSPGSTVAATKGASGGNTVVLAFWDADIPC